MLLFIENNALVPAWHVVAEDQTAGSGQNQGGWYRFWEIEGRPLDKNRDKMLKYDNIREIGGTHTHIYIYTIYIHILMSTYINSNIILGVYDNFVYSEIETW